MTIGPATRATNTSWRRFREGRVTRVSIVLLLTLASALQGGGRASLRDVALAADNPIVIENEQPGSSGWQLGLIADDATGQIKGYASATSVGQNQSLTLYVSVNPAQIYSIDVYRIGWYDGMGRDPTERV